MKKVLIVDDDQDLLEMVELALNEQGFNVCTSAEGKNFFEKVTSFNPDIILLDIFLTDADGRKLCAQLKEDPSLKHIPVALYSAGHITHSSIIESNANLYITKPFDVMQLGEKLKGLLAGESISNFVDKYIHLIRHFIPLQFLHLRTKKLIRLA